MNRDAASAQARATVRGVILLEVLASGLGIFVVVIYIQLLAPLPVDQDRSDLNLAVFGGYLALLMIVAMPINVLILRRAMVWVREGTVPTPRQRWLVFRLPLLETTSAFIGWIGGAVLFGAINEDGQRVAFAIAIAGLVASTFLYLLLEARFRPVWALALEDAELPEGRRDVLPRLMLAWVLGSGVPLTALGVAPLITEDFDPDRLVWIALISAVAGAAVMAGSAISVARPLNRVRRALRSVEQGDLDINVPVDDLGELGRLAEGVNNLVAGLREREELREAFDRQVGHSSLVAPGAVDSEDAIGAEQDVSVLFVDLTGYTAYSESHSPREVVAMLNRFFRVVVAVVNREGGWVNKFEGDAAMCVFGAPTHSPDHAARALRAAHAIPRELARDRRVLPAKVGVASGRALAGYVGTTDRFEYTIIGDVVNVAARLSERARDHRSNVLADAATIEAAGFPEEWVPAGRTRIRGRSQRATVYTIATPRRFRSS